MRIHTPLRKQAAIALSCSRTPPQSFCRCANCLSFFSASALTVHPATIVRTYPKPISPAVSRRPPHVPFPQSSTSSVLSIRRIYFAYTITLVCSSMMALRFMLSLPMYASESAPSHSKILFRVRTFYIVNDSAPMSEYLYLDPRTLFDIST